MRLTPKGVYFNESLTCLILSCAIFAAFSPALPAAAADITQVDIIGLKLGMSPDEVEKIVTAYDKALKVERKYTTYNYSDGKEFFQSPEVLSGIVAQKNVYDAATMSSENESIYLNFSADKENPKLISISRDISGLAKPTTKAKYEEAVKQKYGEPTRTEAPDYMIWHLGGGQYRCAAFANQSKIASQPLELLNDIRTGWDPAKDCEALFVHRVGSDPANHITAALYDPTLIVEADKKLGDWVAKLESDAKAKLTSGAAAPKL